jgi:3-methyladenine DNA glycosylase AlkD
LDVAELATEIDARLRVVPRLTTEQVRVIRREYTARLRAATPELMLELAERLLAMPALPPGDGWGPAMPFLRRFFAYELMANHRAALASLDADRLEALGHEIASWEAVDTFCLYLAGPVWREHQVSDNLIRTWAASPNRWWRRAAVVSTVPLNSRARGGEGDAARTLAICTLLVDDRDDMVVKGMSWALRELAKRDADAVRGFLAVRGDALAPRVRREVQSKLATGLKNPRHRTSGPGV